MRIYPQSICHYITLKHMTSYYRTLNITSQQHNIGKDNTPQRNINPHWCNAPKSGQFI